MEADMAGAAQSIASRKIRYRILRITHLHMTQLSFNIALRLVLGREVKTICVAIDQVDL
jgi:hypothetical protein